MREQAIFVMRINMISTGIVKHFQMKVLQNLLIIFEYMGIISVSSWIDLFVGFQIEWVKQAVHIDRAFVQYGIH